MFQEDKWKEQEFASAGDLDKFEGDLLALKLLDVQKYSKGNSFIMLSAICAYSDTDK